MRKMSIISPSESRYYHASTIFINNNKAHKISKQVWEQTSQSCCLSRSCKLFRLRIFSMTTLAWLWGSCCSKSPSSAAILPSLFESEELIPMKPPFLVGFRERCSSSKASTFLCKIEGSVTCQCSTKKQEKKNEWMKSSPYVTYGWRKIQNTQILKKHIKSKSSKFLKTKAPICKERFLVYLREGSSIVQETGTVNASQCLVLSSYKMETHGADKLQEITSLCGRLSSRSGL